MSSRFSVLGGNLKLLETTEGDADVYICRVKSLGQPDITAKARLTVQSRFIYLKTDVYLYRVKS